MKEYKNILVQYKGSGYDGCIWEWNFFLFDNEGNFHNIITTGSMGIKFRERADTIIRDDKNYIYDLTDDKSKKEFAEENNPSIILTVASMVNEIYEDNILYFICDDCKNKIYPESVADGRLEMWHGAGGIAVTPETILCDEGHILHTCSYCGEFVEDINELDEDGKCEYCRE